jgi:outer membrane autotransporter protein
MPGEGISASARPKELKSESGGILKPWVFAGLQHEFIDSPSATYIVDFASHHYDTNANVQAGLTWRVTDWMQFYGDTGYTTDLTDYHAYRIDVGLRLMW